MEEELRIYNEYLEWKEEFGQHQILGVLFEGDQESYRFQQFKENLLFIEEHNASGDQLVLGMNQFGAMSIEEIEQRYFNYKKGEEINSNIQNLPQVQPTNQQVDWMFKGAVLPALDQGACGSCWAFSAAGGLQGLRYLDDGILERLSIQQMVSCLPAEYVDEGGKNGCDGSETFYAYNMTHQVGIQTQDQYPYVSGQDGYVPPCHHHKNESVYFNDGVHDGFIRIDRGDVDHMKRQAMIQPYSISVASSNIYFAFYRRGTILDTQKCGTKINHSITLVGMYDMEGETPYWLVQNSWGKRWGTNSLGKIAIRGGDGVCGINMKVVYPTSSTYPKPQQQE